MQGMLTHNLGEILKKSGLTQAEAAQKLGITQGALSLYLNGKRQIRMSFLDHFCQVFGVTPAQCLGAQNPTQGVRVLGFVQAGCFQEAWQQESADPLSLPAHITGAYSNTFALEVRGDSMNKVYPDGAFVICVPIGDYPKKLASGVRVVCQRQTPDGLVEATLKEYQETKTGVFLIPLSTNPHFKPINLAQEAGTISICAVVIGCYQSEG